MIEPWYLLEQDKTLHHVIQATELEQSKYPPIMSGYRFLHLEDTVTHYDMKEPLFQPDFLFAPTFMIEDSMYKIWQELQPDILGKAVQFFEANNRENAPMPLYWVPFLPSEEDALHDQTKIELGRAVEPVLRREKLAEKNFLHITLAGGQLWFASLTAVEAMLWKGQTGVQITSVEIR